MVKAEDTLKGSAQEIDVEKDATGIAMCYGSKTGWSEFWGICTWVYLGHFFSALPLMKGGTAFGSLIWQPATLFV